MEEILDIIKCLSVFDKEATDYQKARCLESIQKDILKISDSKNVYIIMDKENHRIYGCFKNKDRVYKYANNSNGVDIIKLEVI